MAICTNDERLFREACEKIVGQERAQNGIGTLQEKTLHAVLKHFYEPDSSYQEICVDNFVADILRDNEIIEIQTRSFNKLRSKLDIFLQYYPVTIVYPIICTKWLYWIDESTGEISKKRKSPKKGTLYDAIPELYKIKSYLTNSNLHICLTLIDAEEYRLLNGWSHDRKKGSTRYDRIPTALIDEYYIGSLADYACLIPGGLPASFTSADFALAAEIPRARAQTTLTILHHIGAVRRTGKSGRSYCYEITDRLTSSSD